MTEFTPIAATIGGLLIGGAAAGMMLFNGRITGVSGIFAGAILPRKADWAWRAAFMVGLLVGGFVYLLATGAPTVAVPRSGLAIAAAGVIVGLGTGWSNGCTSGHGVCGNARLSKRSIVATLTFIGTGAITVAAINTFFGGSV